MKEVGAPYKHTDLVAHHRMLNRRSSGISHDTANVRLKFVQLQYGYAALSDQSPKDAGGDEVSKPAGADVRQEARHAAAQW